MYARQRRIVAFARWYIFTRKETMRRNLELFSGFYNLIKEDGGRKRSRLRGARESDSQWIISRKFDLLFGSIQSPCRLVLRYPRNTRDNPINWFVLIAINNTQFHESRRCGDAEMTWDSLIGVSSNGYPYIPYYFSTVSRLWNDGSIAISVDSQILKSHSRLACHN